MLRVLERALKFGVVSLKHLTASQSEEPSHENEVIIFAIMAASTKATGPLSLLTQTDIFLLLELIEGHEALWNIKSANYRNQCLKKASWTSVRVNLTEKTGIECTDDNVQKKFLALRNTYLRELRLIRDSKTSGSGVDDIRKTTWPYFAAMQFLRGVISINIPTSSNLIVSRETDLDAGNGMHFEAGTQDGPSTPVTEDDSQLNVLEDAPQTSRQSNPCSSRKRKDSPDPLTQSLQTYLASCNDAKQKRLEKNIDKWNIWAANLAENMKKIGSERRKLMLQIDVDELVTKAMREDLLAQTD